MKNYFKLSLIGLLMLSLNSCYVNRTTIGDGPVGKSEAAKYGKAKQMYLFWGLVPLGFSQPAAPMECGYQIKTSFNFFDMLVSGLTGGIFGMRTVKVLVNKDGPCDPAIRRMRDKERREKLEERR